MPKHWALKENSMEDSSWMTISVSDEMENASTLPPPTEDPSPCNENSLDDTIPLDDLGGKNICHDTKKSAQLANFSPLLQYERVKSEAFCKMRTNTSKDNRGHFFSQVDDQHHQNQSSLTVQTLFGRTSSFNPPLSSTRIPLLLTKTSSFNPPHSSTHLWQGSDMSDFKPQLCSTTINENSFNTDFKPHLCSTRLPENESFVPLRSSTGLSDSATFNPISSSTAVKINQSDIPEFKNLKVCCKYSAFKN